MMKSRSGCSFFMIDRQALTDGTIGVNFTPPTSLEVSPVVGVIQPITPIWNKTAHQRRRCKAVHICSYYMAMYIISMASVKLIWRFITGYRTGCTAACRAVQAHLVLLVLQYGVLLELVLQRWLARRVDVAGSQHGEGQVADEAAQRLRAKVKLMIAEGLQKTGCRAQAVCAHVDSVSCVCIGERPLIPLIVYDVPSSRFGCTCCCSVSNCNETCAEDNSCSKPLWASTALVWARQQPCSLCTAYAMLD